ncbi:leukocyte receptor cluster member 1 [Punica granatum]|uniref:CBF1-interacting co-repressor CIR N-terminal domain-containing protein n=2 Tax=Punica granatum TaxID=22663 RepID=A0A218XMH9_PUNGR|nr:leukocyte receptor cluster member 1 [Punica granatum]XP_031374522.1 leukocyte receptor cluster member 1 [Punica granatum]OWM86445.1 hypothetical protein CDL15_Pgr021532 [Punica granatum]PKI39819.1 hypothetical protein CRG98_039864 [Punica granatum]
MGGHGGLNILPQKRWNVYNYENREKVRRDEEAAAKEEQLKREQARKRDAEFRLEQLRTARGLAPLEQPSGPLETDKNPGHINLFEGIRIFDPVKVSDHDSGEGRDGSKRKKMKKEEAPRTVTAEDEKYRLGYGLVGKGVKLPWYLEKRGDDDEQVERAEVEGPSSGSMSKDEGRKKSGKKTLEELREERLKREKKEKERVRELMLGNVGRDGSRGNASKGRGFSRK